MVRTSSRLPGFLCKRALKMCLQCNQNLSLSKTGSITLIGKRQAPEKTRWFSCFFFAFVRRHIPLFLRAPARGPPTPPVPPLSATDTHDDVSEHVPPRLSRVRVLPDSPPRPDRPRGSHLVSRNPPRHRHRRPARADGRVGGHGIIDRRGNRGRFCGRAPAWAVLPWPPLFDCGGRGHRFLPQLCGARAGRGTPAAWLRWGWGFMSVVTRPRFWQRWVIPTRRGRGRRTLSPPRQTTNRGDRSKRL